jgi:mono/diheme cytochrome c family protein
VLLGLSIGHSVGLALVAGAFIVFAILSALVIPRRFPQFPSERLGWFVAATLVLFVGTLAAVEIFAKESEEPEAAESVKEKPGTTTATTGQTTTTPAAPKGDAAAGKAVFDANSCGGCHTFAPAGSAGQVGPNLDEALKGKDTEFVRESIIDPNKEIANGYGPGVMPTSFGDSLSKKELDDLVAFLLQQS